MKHTGRILFILVLLFLGVLGVNASSPQQSGAEQEINTSRSATLDRKADVILHLSLPYINSFRLNPKFSKIVSKTGFIGGSFGLDYFHQNNQFLSLSLSRVLSHDTPFPVGMALEVGQHHSMSSTYLSLTNNHKIDRFSFGYGLCYGKNEWEYYEYEITPIRQHNQEGKTTNALGLVLNSYISFYDCINVGVVYRPTFIRFNSQKTFSYEHLISLDVALKIRLFKIK